MAINTKTKKRRFLKYGVLALAVLIVAFCVAGHGPQREISKVSSQKTGRNNTDGEYYASEKIFEEKDAYYTLLAEGNGSVFAFLRNEEKNTVDLVRIDEDTGMSQKSTLDMKTDFGDPGKDFSPDTGYLSLRNAIFRDTMMYLLWEIDLYSEEDPAALSEESHLYVTEIDCESLDALNTTEVNTADTVYRYGRIIDGKNGVAYRVGENGSLMELSVDGTEKELPVKYDGFGKKYALADLTAWTPDTLSLTMVDTEYNPLAVLYDIQTGKTEPLSFLPSEYWIIEGSNTPYTFSTTSTGYCSKDKINTELFSWIEVGIDGTAIAALPVQDQMGDFWVPVYTNTGTQIYRVSKCGQEEFEDGKEILTLAMDYGSNGYAASVIDFNEKSEKYKIVIDDCSTHEDVLNGYKTASEELYDVINGDDAPDMFLASIEFPIRKAVLTGKLEDLNEHLGMNENIKKDDILPNVVDMIEDDGKMPYLIPGFGIMSFESPAAADIQKNGISWDEFFDQIDTSTSVSLLNTTKTDLFNNLFYCYSGKLLNKNGSGNFGSVDFMNILRYSNRFADYIDEYADMQQAFSDGVVMFMMEPVYCFGDAEYYRNIVGTDVAYLGMPTDDGSFMASIMPTAYCGLLKTSEHKEVAWDYLSSLFTKEEQYDMRDYSFSIRSDVNEDVCADCIKKASDVKAEAEKSGETLDYIVPTEKDFKNILGLTKRVNSLCILDQNIMEIVLTDASYYFDGLRTLTEVMEFIQKDTMQFAYAD